MPSEIFCKPHFKTLEIPTVYSIYIHESAKFVESNQHLFKTNEYQMYETRNINKFEKIMHRNSKFEKVQIIPAKGYRTVTYHMFANKIF